jgi:hypothetical protein
MFALARRRGSAFTWHLAITDGRAVGHFSEQVKHGIGYLEDLFVLPEFHARDRHGAGAALRRVGAEEGAGLVFLPRTLTTARAMYSRMGFEPLYVFRNFAKQVETSAAACSQDCDAP